MKIKLIREQAFVRKHLLFIVMRVFIFLLCTTVFGFSTENTFSQERIIIDADKEVSVNEVFRIIKNQTKYRFLYPEGLFDETKRIHLKKGEILLTKLLKQSFSGSNVKFELSKNHTIVIKEKRLQQLIKGKVNDDDGLPLSGVSILIKGTTTGAATDFDGNYQISADTGDVLEFSFLGYTTQEIIVTEASQTIDVTLKVIVGKLDEIIVTAQGIRKEKKALGYAVTTLEGTEVENKAESDVSRSLQGKVAGVQIFVESGSTGDQANIRVRGNLSITGNNEPLLVVDNVPFSGNLIDINPNNIKNISVLKGLNASILYGSEGRNGVILITTKSGSSSIGEKKISINFSQTVYTNEVASLPDYQNTYGQGRDNAFSGGDIVSWGAAFSELDFIPHPYANNPSFPEFAGVEIPYEATPNNVKDFFDTGIGKITALNFNSSQEKTAFNLSAGYTDETGIIGKNDLKRFNLAIGGSAQITDKLNISATFNYTTRKRNSQSGLTLFSTLLYLPRNLDLFNLPYQDPITGANVYFNSEEHPLWTINNTGSNDDVTRLFTTINTKYDINNHWSLNYRIGIDNNGSDGFDFRNKGGDIARTGFLSLSYNKSEIIDQSLILNTNYKLSDKIGFDSQLGLNSKTTNVKSNSSRSGDQVVFGFFRPNNFDTQTANATRARENLLGVFAALEFNYDRYLFLSLSGRNDWSSTLEKENQSIFYPGASVSFLPTSAFNFDSKTVNYLKVRAAYATSAGFPSRFNTRQTLESDSNRFVTEDGSIRASTVPRDLANPNLKAELHKEFEVGIESKLFNNRVSLDASVFKRVSKDQIVNRRLDTSTGFGATSINIGRVDTDGVELNLGVDIFKSENFNWNLTNVFTAYESTVVELSSGPFALGRSRFAIEGEAFGVIQTNYAAKDSEGNFLIDPNNGEILSSNQVGLPDKIVGDPTPDWRLATINSFSYRNFTLSTQFEYTHGGDNLSDTFSELVENGVLRGSENRDGSFIIPGVYGDRSTGLPFLDANGQPIPNTIQQNGNRTASGNYYDARDNYVFDASVFRIREVALSYNINGRKNNLPFDNLAITLSGRNLFFIAPNYPKYANLDPEVDKASTVVPSTKRYAIGINVSF
ncbi:SusC/RagA family TonB-linked outer membrane protein [Flavivirga eckloniae]|uniref:SusC/RagA family TonB-linked outer membrane protein n=1 Tax=Flavivirga eckloniae TaxID=1803846 RepID=A0A2K9PQK5_9FLAO|nr:SusC/RagA family TonB-linked outer membrane protein [Flavivirga eckloniae]AUP79108.1 hypothetical protein C1H87_10520 [Flavivirga eckloniae]